MTQLEPQKITQVHATYHGHPLLPAADRHECTMEVQGETLLELLQQFPTHIHRLDVIAYVNGNVVPRLNWADYKLNQGDEVVLKQAVHGGDSNPLQIILMIVVIVAAVYTGGAAAAAYGGWGTTAGAMAGAAAQAAVMVAGSLIVQAIFPPQMPKGMKQENSFNISGTRNTPRLGEPLPLVVGTVRMSPDIGMKPYVEQDSSDAYLSSVFNYGFGNLEISNTKIGNSDLSSYQEVAYQFANNGAQLQLVAGNVDSLEGGELTKADGWISRTTPANTTRIGVDIGGQLFKTNDDGDIEVYSVDVEVQYKATSSNTWLPWTGAVTANNYTASIVGRLGRAFFGGGSTAPNAAGVFTIWHGKTKPLRWATMQSVDEGTYDVRVRKLSDDKAGPKKFNSITLGQIRCFQIDTADYAYQTRLGVRIRATGQLNGQIENLNSIVTAKIPAWNGSAWVANTASSNPADIFYYIAKGQRDANGKRLWGAGLADSRIDLVGIQEWSEWCATKGLECNYVFAGGMTIYEMLAIVARCGRGSVSWQKGTLGVVYDRENLPITQIFTPANIITDSFNVTYLTKNLADSITCKFVNSALDYQEDTVTVNMPGVVDPTNPTELTLLGITTPNVAFRETSLLAARQYYNRRRVSFETDVEGLVCSKGDVISLSHDLTSWGMAGRLISGNTTHLQLDREVTFTSSNTHYMTIRTPDGTMTAKALVNPYVNTAVTTTSVQLASALSINPNTDPDNDPRDYMFIFDYTATPGKKLKVVAVIPNGENRVQIHAIDEDPNYYDAENGISTYVPPTTMHGSPAYVSNIVVTEQYQGYGQPLKLFITWDLTQARGARLEIRQNNGTWQDYGVIDGGGYELDLVSWYVNDELDFRLTPVEFIQTKAATNVAEVTYFIKGMPDVVGNINLPTITGLEIFNQANDGSYTGQSAKFVWRKVQTVREEVGSETLGAESGSLDPYFQDYEIKIWDTSGVLRRTEHTTDESYEYTWEKNTEDGNGTPVRSFRIAVYYRSKTNQVGLPATMVATNPAPSTPSNVIVSTITKTLYVQCQRPQDLDIQGMAVYVGTTSDFTPSANTEVHRGPDSAVTLDSGVTGLEYGVTRYVKVGFYDLFANTPSNFSAANTVIPTQLSDQDVQNLTNSRMGLAGDTTGWVDPVITPMGEWVLLAGSVANANVNVTGTGPFNTTSPLLTLKGDGTAGGWYSAWNSLFDVTPSRAHIAYVWVKKRSVGTTRGLYLGWTTTAGRIKTLGGIEETNPYFVEDAGSTMTVGKWYLAVGVIHGHDAAGSLDLAGLYDPETGTRLVNGTEFKHFDDTVLEQFLRFGFFSDTDSITSTGGFEFASPQVYAMDGAEPSLSYLLRRSWQQGALATLNTVSLTEFASGIEPVQIVSTLPASVSGNSNTVLLTSDSKIYRWNGSAYTAAVANTDFTGQIISTQISDEAITTPKLAANAVTANIIAANAVTASAIAADAITAGKIAAGAVSADEIAANAITASKLAITNQGMAINRNPQMNVEAWYSSIMGTNPANTNSEFTNVEVAGAPVGNAVFQYSGSTGVEFASETMPIDATRVYRVTVWMKQTGTVAKNYLTCAFIDSSGAVTNAGGSGFSVGTFSYWGLVNQAAGTTWTKYTLTFGPGQAYTAPTAAKFLRIGCLVNYGSLDTTTIQFSDYRIEEVLPASLIVDGAITASKITVANLSSVSADMGSVNAGIITLDTTGHIKSGQTGYNTGTGFWLGKDGATTKLSLGNSSGNNMTWDGTNLSLTGGIRSKNYVAGSSGWNLAANGNAEVNDITVRGDYLTNTGIKFEITPDDATWLMYAGPAGSVKSMANAVFYIRKDGSAYFGGSLSAGVLKNAATGTAISATANVILGPFGTQGAQKVVTCSYYCHTHQSLEGTMSFTDPPTANVILERSLDGGSNWTYLTSQVMSGGVSYEPGWNWSEPGFYMATINGSYTFTDTSTSTANFMYRLRVASRNMTMGTTTEQKLTVVSVEE